MKRLLFAVVLCCFGVLSGQSAWAGCDNQCLKGAVPCSELSKYLPQYQLATEAREWGPYKGSFRVVGEKTLRVVLRFDQEAINTFKSRSDFALEIDIVDPSKILGKASSKWGFDASSMKGTRVIKDTAVGDAVNQLSLVIIYPQVLVAEKDYEVYFYTENPISQSGELKLNVGLSVYYTGSLSCSPPAFDVPYLSDAWKYFALEIDQFREFEYTPNGFGNLGICWVNHDNSGPQYCEDAFSVTMCAWTSSGNRVCWKTKNGLDRSCEHATAWYTSNPVTGTSGPTNVSVCPTSCYAGPNTSSIFDFLIRPAYAAGTLSSCARKETSEDYSFGTSSPGAGSSTPATDPVVPNKPDFIVDRLRLFASDKVTETYRFKKTDTLCMEGKLKNIGDGKIGDSDIVRTRFMLSKGYKEDSHGDWNGIASFDTQGRHVERGESHTETVCATLSDKAYVLPGRVYNIVACADRTEVNNNDGGKYQEEHESNNCTTEAVFEVEATYNFALNGFNAEKNSLSPNGTVKVYVNVKNVLDQPNEDVPVSLSMSPNGDWGNRSIVDTFAVSKDVLGPNGSLFWTDRSITFPPSPGQYTLWACVNPDGAIHETDAGDNCKSLPFMTDSSLTSSPKDLSWLVPIIDLILQ